MNNRHFAFGKLSGVWLVVITSALWFGAATADDNVVVTEAVWTSGIDHITKQYRTKFINLAPRKPLFFWTRLEGTAEALEELRRKGKLPITDEWYLWISGEKLPDDPAQPIDEADVDGDNSELDAISVNVGRLDLIKKLEIEVRERGFFDWRTWTRKRNVSSGLWEVDVVYHDGTPVQLRAPDGTKDCKFFIRVQ